MADLTPKRLLELYWTRSSHPKAVYAAVPKASMDPAGLVLWACLREDLKSRMERLPDAATLDIIVITPPKRTIEL